MSTTKKLVKLGKRAPVSDPRTFKMAKYVQKLNIPPKSVFWSKACDKNWPMYRNDQIGDCTCASAGHMIESWTANGQLKEIEITETKVVNAYKNITGYDPKDPSTDNGAVELDVLNFWRKRGIGGHKIGAFVQINIKNIEQIKQAIFIFGGIYTGLSLPISAQDQKVWSIPSSGKRGEGAVGSWGGHAVPILDYDSKYMTCVTWGALQKMTWEFWLKYADEAYAVISKDFLTRGKSPNGMDMNALVKDLDALKR